LDLDVAVVERNVCDGGDLELQARRSELYTSAQQRCVVGPPAKASRDTDDCRHALLTAAFEAAPSGTNRSPRRSSPCVRRAAISHSPRLSMNRARVPSTALRPSASAIEKQL